MKRTPVFREHDRFDRLTRITAHPEMFRRDNNTINSPDDIGGVELSVRRLAVAGFRGTIRPNDTGKRAPRSEAAADPLSETTGSGEQSFVIRLLYAVRPDKR